MSDCPKCASLREAFAQEVEMGNGDRLCVAILEAFLAECPRSTAEMMMTDYVRRKLEDALSKSGSAMVPSIKGGP